MKPLHKPLISFTLILTVTLIVLYLCTLYKEQIAGGLLGLWVSCYNVLFIGRKLRIVEEEVVATKASRSRGTGMLHRFCMITLAVMLAYKYPQYIDARAIVVGLPLCYIFLFVQQFIEMRREVVSLRKG